MYAAKTAGVCLVLAGIALAGPSFRIGTKLTWHGAEAYSESLDTTGAPISRTVYERFSVGPAIEASYGPVWGVFTGRVDLAQLSIFTSSPGGAGFSMFPMLGLDVMAEPPTQWRVKPYAWVGVRTTGYTQPPFTGVQEVYHDSETHWRGGLGVKYSLNHRTDLFAETQWYSRDTYWEGAMFEAIGLVSAEIGARFALGK
ncbi:hypothetical protein JXD38_04635 [candidate division WOR-3 bacterium]|nr:hypothetical protein [candidate division WOR-3 bacterium]